jgi:uncharacterized protein YjbI with pentapeptide repeats
MGMFKPTRVAFWPTAWLHEQHAHIYPIADTAEKEKYDTLRAKGAKHCESLDKSPKDEKTATKDIEEKPVQYPCLMVPPGLLPRNLILREKVLTATIDPNLKPELEAKLHWKAADNTFRPSSLSDIRSVSLNNPPTLADALAQVVGLNLQNRNFDYADFTELSLPKVDLRYASLKHAKLTYTQLVQAQLESAHLADADMTRVNLTGADMSNATLTGANMIVATLTGVAMHSADLTGADMSNANLTGANMIVATLTGANMTDATLTGANMTDATLTSADMSDVNLTGADMSNANLTGADMSRTTLTGADMTGANLTGAILISIDTDMPSEQALKKITADYQQQLALIPRYQTDPSSLATEINDFTYRLSQPADFSGVKKIKPCLRSGKNSEKALHDCTAIGQLNTQTQTDLVAVWRKLACDDKTKEHWLAQSMLNRALPFPWFAQALLDAAKDPNTCLGLANLTAEHKVVLQEQVVEVVEYESRKQGNP